MSQVVTLIAAPAFAELDAVAATLARRLDADVDWLAAGRAVDLVVEAMAPAQIDAEAAAAIGDAPVDRAVQPLFGRRKRLLIADMDSTFITVECIDVLARHAGIGAEIAEITQRTIRGELEFGNSLRHRVGLLAGAPLALLERAWSEDVGFMPGGATLLATMRAHGALTALVSGGFTWFTGRVAAALGFDLHRANELDLDGDTLSGRLVEPVLDRGAKLAVLHELVHARGLAMSETMAVGDGANDIAMLEAAGLGVAYHAVPVAEDAADVAVRHNDLGALLYIQGYRQNEIIQA